MPMLAQRIEKLRITLIMNYLSGANGETRTLTGQPTGT